LGAVDINCSGCFPGKKIAFLQDKSLVLVPKSARAGDKICCFNTSPVPFVLRDIKESTESETESVNCLAQSDDKPLEYTRLIADITEFFSNKKHIAREKLKIKEGQLFNFLGDRVENGGGPDSPGASLLWSLDTSKVTQCTFIGECFHKFNLFQFEKAMYTKQKIFALC